MRKSPVNYILTIVVVGVLWIGTAVFVGKYLGENAALANVTSEDFGRTYMIIMSIAAFSTIIGLSHWYWHGAKDSTAADPRGARRFWSVWFFILIIASVSCVAGVVVAFLHESFTALEYLIVFGCASLLTWVPYWMCSLLMSPRGVKPAVFGG